MVWSGDDLFDRPQAVLEAFCFDVDALKHREEQVAHAGVIVDRTRADAVVLLSVGDVVFTDGGEVEIHVGAMLIPEGFSAAEDGGQVGVSVAVAVRHSASPEDLRGVEQGLSVLLVLFELIEEVAELIDEEGVGCRESAELLWVAVVMAESVPRLEDSDFRDATGVAFAADSARDDTG